MQQQHYLFYPILIILVQATAGDSQPALPYFTANPASIAVEGSIVSLQCDLSDSADNITVKWSVNNTELTVPAGNYAYGTNYELVISNFDDSLNGNYTCIAMTESWILRSATADVRKSFITANYDDAGIFEIHVTAQDNSELIIPCDPNYTGYPLDEVTFTWEALGSGADETNENNYIKSGTDARNKFRVSSNGTMVIANVMEDETYQCTIDIDTNEIYYRVKVVVEESPSSTNIPHIVFPPENVIANVGETVIFDCIAGGETFPMTTWTPPSEVENFDQIEGNTELRVNTVSENNEGLYSCQVSGIAATFSATLTIRDPPVLIEAPPESVNVTYGQSQSLTCTATGDDIQLIWYHNGVMISNNNTITISNADLSDGGAYQCFAVGPTKFATNSTFVTINTIAPILLPNGTLQNQIAFTGRNLTLSCQATGAPEPSYIWFRDDTNAAELVTFGVDLSTPGTLKIPNIIGVFEGMYTCIATSELNGMPIGKDNSSAMVIITDPTVFESVNPNTVNSYIGDPFYLNCTVTHDTQKTSVELSWTLNGIKITNTTILTIKGETSLHLNISSASQQSQGVYQCIATTMYTSDSSFLVPTVVSPITTVTIADAPIEPTVTLVKAVGSTVLEVSWTYKGFVNNLKEYQIEYEVVTVTSSSEWMNGSTHPKSGTTVRNITGLNPYTEYNIRVVAILDNNNNERVLSSAFGPTRTEEDVPTTAPDRVSCSAVENSTTSLQLEWLAPSQTNGIITDYTIRYSYNDTREGSTVLEEMVGSNATTHTLRGLVPNTPYMVQIAAHTAVGRGPFSVFCNKSIDPSIEPITENSTQFYTKIWFILICTAIVLLLVVILSTVVAILRWRHKNKGNMYSVRNNYFTEEISLTEDVVADYNRKRDRPMGFTESIDGSKANLHDTQQLEYPSFGRTESLRGSMRGSLRGSFRGSIKGLPPPPEYINPPSFEETLKARLGRNRSASTTLLEKVDHGNFRGSGWSVGHDPKSSTAFFLPQQHPHDPEVDSMVGKPRFAEPGEETSGESDTSTGLHTQSATNVESFAQFV